jgi:hypothetical protein
MQLELSTKEIGLILNQFDEDRIPKQVLVLGKCDYGKQDITIRTQKQDFYDLQNKLTDAQVNQMAKDLTLSECNNDSYGNCDCKILPKNIGGHNDLVRKTFKLEGLEETFDGYLDLANPSWNGWAIPLFPKSERDEFIKTEMKFVSENLCSDNMELLEGIMSVKPTKYQNETLYDLGCGLCWSVVEDEGEE